MGLYKRGGTWWMRFTVGGRQELHPTSPADKRLAQRILAKAQAMVAEGRWFADDGSRDMTFADMTARYAHHGPESLRSSVNALDELAQN